MGNRVKKRQRGKGKGDRLQKPKDQKILTFLFISFVYRKTFYNNRFGLLKIDRE